MGLCSELASAPVSHAKREWGKPRQVGAASLSSPVETTAVAHGGDPRRSALPPQDRNGAFDP